MAYPPYKSLYGILQRPRPQDFGGSNRQYQQAVREYEQKKSEHAAHKQAWIDSLTDEQLAEANRDSAKQMEPLAIAGVKFTPMTRSAAGTVTGGTVPMETWERLRDRGLEQAKSQRVSPAPVKTDEELLQESMRTQPQK